MSITIGLIADGRIRTDGFVARTINLNDLPGMIDSLASRRVEAIKILVDPSEG